MVFEGGVAGGGETNERTARGEAEERLGYERKKKATSVAVFSCRYG